MRSCGTIIISSDETPPAIWNDSYRLNENFASNSWVDVRQSAQRIGWGNQQERRLKERKTQPGQMAVNRLNKSNEQGEMKLIRANRLSRRPGGGEILPASWPVETDTAKLQYGYRREAALKGNGWLNIADVISAG